MSRHGYYRHAERSFDQRLGIVRKSGAVRLGKTIVPPKHAFVPPSTDGYHRHRQKMREGPNETVTEQPRGQAVRASKLTPKAQSARPVAPAPQLQIVVFQMGVPIPMYFGSQYVH